MHTLQWLSLDACSREVGRQLQLQASLLGLKTRHRKAYSARELGQDCRLEGLGSGQSEIDGVDQQLQHSAGGRWRLDSGLTDLFGDHIEPVLTADFSDQGFAIASIGHGGGEIGQSCGGANGFRDNRAVKI